ncbi:four helix bundle protein [Candidatus Peregrinibacteria bacterium]|nr:MAG: four helix bundle protein [Candidatus Peregrinibacteria bacterium]
MDKSNPNTEFQIHKSQTIPNVQISNKPYDLEKRTFNFAKNCKNFCKKIPRTQSNYEYSKQLIRASGSQAANYIEANEAATKKELLYRIRICRKEFKESSLWLRLIDAEENELKKEQELLQDEINELRKIFNAIYNKSGGK